MTSAADNTVSNLRQQLYEENERLIEEANTHRKRLGYTSMRRQKSDTSIVSLQDDNEHLKADIDIYKKCKTAKEANQMRQKKEWKRRRKGKQMKRRKANS